MTITGEGLTLGAGTVLAARRRYGIGLDLDRAGERLLTLLSIAYNPPISAAVIDNVRRASRAWADGDACLAHIHLARSGLPPLSEDEAAPFRLFAAARLIDQGISPRTILEYCAIDAASLDALKANFNPDEPRIPAGSGPESGEWTDDDDAAAIPARVRRTEGSFPADKDLFFDTLYAPVRAAAGRLGLDETWMLGLAAHESGWLKPHNREINNPFGVTHGGGNDVHYDSIDEAVAAWERRYGSIVQGATSAEDFVARLQTVPYNRSDPLWSNGVLGGIRSVQRRIESWKSRHGI